MAYFVLNYQECIFLFRYPCFVCQTAYTCLGHFSKYHNSFYHDRDEYTAVANGSVVHSTFLWHEPVYPGPFLSNLKLSVINCLECIFLFRYFCFLASNCCLGHFSKYHNLFCSMTEMITQQYLMDHAVVHSPFLWHGTVLPDNAY